MTLRIIEISANETWSIRHQVMWPNEPIDFIKLPKDSLGTHYGLFLDKKLISVISLFIDKDEAQFRKFATIEDYQGKGYGSILLNEIMQIAINKSLSKIWCNARLNKTSFYTKFGLKLTETTYNKGGIEFVVMERVLK